MFRREAVVSAGRIHFPEAIQVELADKAGEVFGLEGVNTVRVGRAQGQNLPLKELSVDDNSLTLTVPEDGPVCRVVHQTPQLGREVVRVDIDRERSSTNIHDYSLLYLKKKKGT